MQLKEMGKFETPTFCKRVFDSSKCLFENNLKIKLPKINKYSETNSSITNDFTDNQSKHSHKSKSKNKKKSLSKEKPRKKKTLIQKKFILRNDFDKKNSEKFLSDKLRCLEPMFLSDEIPTQD